MVYVIFKTNVNVKYQVSRDAGKWNTEVHCVGKTIFQSFFFFVFYSNVFSYNVYNRKHVTHIYNLYNIDSLELNLNRKPQQHCPLIINPNITNDVITI